MIILTFVCPGRSVLLWKVNLSITTVMSSSGLIFSNGHSTAVPSKRVLTSVLKESAAVATSAACATHYCSVASRQQMGEPRECQDS